MSTITVVSVHKQDHRPSTGRWGEIVVMSCGHARGMHSPPPVGAATRCYTCEAARPKMSKAEVLAMAREAAAAKRAADAQAEREAEAKRLADAIDAAVAKRLEAMGLAAPKVESAA